MAVQTEAAAAGRNWYARTPEEAAAAAGVAPGVGLSAAQAADLLAKNGPNSLPEEKPRPGWRRFLGEYRSYMQIILVAAAVVSLLIKEWSTAVLLILLTVLTDRKRPRSDPRDRPDDGLAVHLLPEGGQDHGSRPERLRRRPPW